LKFWQSLFLTEADQLLETAKICEEVGFDGVMVSDHLLDFERVESSYPYSPDGRPPFPEGTVWPECWSTISAMAAVTERIRFVTNVYVLPLRNPIEVAKAAATAASFCEDRLVLGAGAGWMKEEFDLLGVDFASRGRRFDECIDVLRKLWTGEMVEHRGEFFRLAHVKLSPMPREPIPIYIGGMSTAALRRAARLGDGWIGPGQTPQEALATVRRLDRLRSEAGRSAEPFDAIVPLSVPPDPEILMRLRDAGVGGAVSYPFAFAIGPGSTLEQKRAYLEGYADAVISKLRA
jgi:probable F420-dependent oxidoreductase